MVSGVTHLCSAARAPLHLAVPVVTESVASYPPLAGITHCGTQWRTCTTTITYAAERVHEMPPSFLSLFQSVGFTVAMQWMRMILYSHFGASFHVWVSFMTMKTAASCPELLVYQWLLFLLLIFCCFCIFFFFYFLLMLWNGLIIKYSAQGNVEFIKKLTMCTQILLLSLRHVWLFCAGLLPSSILASFSLLYFVIRKLWLQLFVGSSKMTDVFLI